MTKNFLLRLTEEHYGAGAFPVYGRLLEEQRRIEAGQGVNDELLDTMFRSHGADGLIQGLLAAA